jgi:heat shock protein HtpX
MTKPEQKLRRTYRLTMFISWGIWLGILAAIGMKTWWIVSGVILLLQILGLLLGASQVLRGGRAYLKREGLHPVTERTQPILFNLVQDVAQRMGTDLPTIYIIEDKTINAFVAATGLRRRIMVFHTGWLENADAAVTRGVVAHELAHYINNDSLVTAITHGSFKLGVSTGKATMKTGSKTQFGKPQPAKIILRGMGYALVWLTTIPFLAVKRSRESLADLTAAKNLGSVEPVVACLRLLLDYEEALRKGFSSSQSKEMYQTHPATKRRLNFILEIGQRQASKIS